MKKGARGETLLPSVPLPRAAAPEAPAASTGARADGRGAEEFRPVFFNTKVVSQATGSAYAEFDRTKVMVAVYGPRQSERKFGFVDTGRVNVEVSITRFASQARERQALLSEQRAFQDTLQRAIEGSVLLHRCEGGGYDAIIAALWLLLYVSFATRHGMSFHQHKLLCDYAQRCGSGKSDKEGDGSSNGSSGMHIETHCPPLQPHDPAYLPMSTTLVDACTEACTIPNRVAGFQRPLWTFTCASSSRVVATWQQLSRRPAWRSVTPASSCTTSYRPAGMSYIFFCNIAMLFHSTLARAVLKPCFIRASLHCNRR